jgi:hypothetical protein
MSKPVTSSPKEIELGEFAELLAEEPVVPAGELGPSVVGDA